ncbi:MAG: nuclear transport factor 2 family protein, partial [Candidatus Wallbacteria bacterium]|nr:nuclear transport factor 2 family protein [Candidatus Wallbacteria bacterium]
MPKKSSIPQALQAWIDARKRHHLSHAHVQMARELGMNPKKLGKLDNHRQEPWKAPLPQFIEQLYERRFHRRRPQSVRTLEGMPAGEMGKQAERHAAKAARLDAEGYGAAETALGFVDRINDRDAAGLKAMMTDDHRFVDATGAVHGREA